jgi:hypothetical protein
MRVRLVTWNTTTKPEETEARLQTAIDEIEKSGVRLGPENLLHDYGQSVGGGTNWVIIAWKD